MVGGMNANLADFDDLKDVGRDFKDTFSDKDFQGKDSNYPYSEQYFKDRRLDAWDALERSWNKAVDKLSEVNLGGSSGSEAVRQARLNASDIAGKPNRVEIEDNGRN